MNLTFSDGGDGLTLTGDGLSLGGGGDFGLSLNGDEAEAENPLEGVDIEAEAEQEMSEALKLFKARAQAADQRFVDNTDSEYWFAIGFQNRAQKDEFLHKLGLYEHGDKYLDGVEVARVLGIKLETQIPEMPKFGHNHAMDGLAPVLDAQYVLPEILP